MSIDTDLDWADAARATSYDAYFGTSNPPPSVGNTATSNWTLNTLGYQTTYYWKIVSKNVAGDTVGSVWSFTTAANRSIVAWGNHGSGQCQVPPPNTDFTAAAAGWEHSLGLKADGSIVAWGSDALGQCNVPPPNTGFVAIAAGLGLKADGSIVAWPGSGYVPPPNTGFVAVSSGGCNLLLGLKADGSIKAWGGGDNYFGQYNVPPPNTGFTAIDAGCDHAVGLKADGSIVGWGNNNHGQCDVPAPNTDFVAIAAGQYHSLGLKANGTIVVWGWNNYGQCNAPSPSTGFTAIAGGYAHNLGLRGGSGGNAAPQITNTSATGSLIQGQAGTVTVSCTATDTDGTVQSVKADLSAIGGSATQALTHGSGNQWSWSGSVTPPSSGSKTVTFTATDDDGASGTGQASITVAPPANVAPQVTDTSATGSLTQGQAGTVTVSCTATDTDGTVQSVSADLSPIGGSATQALTHGSGNQWSWSGSVTPPSSGSKTVTFTATDDDGATGAGQTTITVQAGGTVAQPTFNPDGGTFTMSQSVTISCATSGATIRYTTDGSTPSQTNGTIITSGGSVNLTSTITLKAIAYKSGMTDSPVKSATYTMSGSLVVIGTVFVGNAGNVGELSGEGAGGYGPDRICGSVAYDYRIGKYEVTAEQYCAFLNAVAKLNTYGLYNTNMDTVVNSYGCNIKRSGSSGSYTYTVGDGTPTDVTNWANRPVNFASWGDAARFANWMHNGQPIGAQGLGTTEDGSYYLNGATSNADLMAVMRKANATWVIPSEDEWYKAAYHKNDGVTGNYWDYPTGTNAVPNNGNPEGDTGNSANFDDGDYTIGSPYWRTNAGFFGQSDSPYGTFDQGGNVWEWNEAILYGTYRALRGGAFNHHYDIFLHASYRYYCDNPPNECDYIGFRVVEVH